MLSNFTMCSECNCSIAEISILELSIFFLCVIFAFYLKILGSVAIVVCVFCMVLCLYIIVSY